MIKFSAPGSLMILGEHSVLHGYNSLVGAIDKRLSVSLTPRTDRLVTVTSNLGTHEFDLTALTYNKTFQFIFSTLAYFRRQLPNGFNLTITSEINSVCGFGSSAALVVALCACVRQYIGLDSRPIVNKHKLSAEAKKIIISTQGSASGSDAVASVFGGIVSYAPATGSITKLPYLLDLICIYSGYKTPTPEVIQIVNGHAKENPNHFDSLFKQMGEITTMGTTALQANDLDAFAKAITSYQLYMEAIGVCDDTLSQILKDLSQEDSILASKISGSGLGDSLIGIRNPDTPITTSFNNHLLIQDVSLHNEGLRYET